MHQLTGIAAAVSELAQVLGAIEVTHGLGDEAVVADEPFLVTADANMRPGAAGAGVMAIERPAIDGAVAFGGNAVHNHAQVWKGGHEVLRRSGNGCAANRRQ